MSPDDYKRLLTLADMMERQASITQDEGEARGRRSCADMLRNLLRGSDTEPGDPPTSTPAPLPDMRAPRVPKIDPEPED